MLLVTCIIFILTRSQAHQGWYGILEEVDILADVVQTGWLRLMVQVALEELDDGFPSMVMLDSCLFPLRSHQDTDVFLRCWRDIERNPGTEYTPEMSQ